MLIKVDHRNITVRSRRHKHRVGVFKDRECLIEISPEQTTQQQADTLIHEVFHAIWATRALPPMVEEEECVTRLASGWTTVLRDNPDLVLRLMQALEEGTPLFTKGD